MTVALVLGTMVLLQMKHFAVDFLLQTRYQWENKGTYLHPVDCYTLACMGWVR